MTKSLNQHQFDLEERTLSFARSVRNFTKLLSKSISNMEYTKQVIRSSASIGANYIEANEALSKKDFLMRIKISRKETKETRYWLNLIEIGEDLSDKHYQLLQECTELLKIFSSIINKSL